MATPYDRIVQRVLPEVEYHQNRYARCLSGVVHPGARWLDLGAGTQVHGGWVGPGAEAVAQRAALLVGCDIVIDHLRRNAALTTAVGADANHLPFADGSFDVVSANMVVEHLDDPRRTFDEIARVLAPGGCFVFVTPNRHNPVVWLSSLLLSRPARKALAMAYERRAEEHIFHTYYRANTVGDVQRHIRGLPLRATQLEAFSSYPFARRPAALTLAESFWIRLIQHPALGRFRSNLVGELCKT